MAFQVALDGDGPAARWLRAHGARLAPNVASLFRRTDLDDGRALLRVATDLGITDAAGLDELERDLYRIITLAKDECHMYNEQYSNKNTWDMSADSALKRMREETERQMQQNIVGSVKAARSKKPGVPTRPRYATTRAGAQRRGDVVTRDRVEADAKAYWTEVIAGILRDAEAPSLAELAGSLQPQRLLALRVGGRRASTLRARAREWRRYAAWLWRVKSKTWPSAADDVLDYGLERLEEPCTKSVLAAFKSTLTFIERLAGRQPQLYQCDAVDMGLKALIREAAGRLDGRAIKRANPPLVSMLIAMEKFVVDADQDDYDRMICWWCLTSTWSCFRYDDHRGIAPRDVKVTEAAVEFTLGRTKTTGPDKAVKTKTGVVSVGASLAVPDWLLCGWQLWQQHAPFERDFLLCRAGAHETCQPEELTYVAYAAHMRYLLAKLVCGPSGLPLGESLAQCFSPHSFRAFMPSCLKALEAGKDNLAWLAAWQAKGGERYARTGRHQTLLMQNRIADIISVQLAKGDPIGEMDTIDAVQSLLAERNVGEPEIGRIVKDIKTFGPADRDTPNWTSWSTTRPSSPTTATAAAPSASSSSLATWVANIIDAPKKGTKHEDAAKEAEEEEGAGDIIPAQGYTVSISRKKRIRTLHLIGSCYRRPGVDYANYEHLGLEDPPASAYNAYCRSCWRGEQRPVTMKEDDDSASSCTTGEESSSTGVE